MLEIQSEFLRIHFTGYEDLLESLDNHTLQRLELQSWRRIMVEWTGTKFTFHPMTGETKHWTKPLRFRPRDLRRVAVVDGLRFAVPGKVRFWLSKRGILD